MKKQLLVFLLYASIPSAFYAQTMVTKHLYEFATPGGAGFPNDDINDHEAFKAAQAFFQAPGQLGNGTLILEDGVYIMGVQQLRDSVTQPAPGPEWEALGYPSAVAAQCKSMVANLSGFVLRGCSNFTIQGSGNTIIRYRDCLYYGTFFRDEETGAISSAVGLQDVPIEVITVSGQDTVISLDTVQRCITCDDPVHLPDGLDLNLRHAQVGVMLTFYDCDSITVRDLELDGNLNNAILGGKPYWDGYQTWYDGIQLLTSVNCLIDNVNAHHFGKDGLQLDGGVPPSTLLAHHPDLEVDADGTIYFNNTVKDCKFNWNTRQGISWVVGAGLTVTNCEMNYTGAGRLASAPSAGLDIEGGGNPYRLRRGVFNDCEFLHNRGAGVHVDTGPCYGQQDFRFSKCVFKAGRMPMHFGPTVAA